MDWLVDLESTCSALGTADGKEYVRDEQCEEGVKDLIRFVSVISRLQKECGVFYLRRMCLNEATIRARLQMHFLC